MAIFLYQLSLRFSVVFRDKLSHKLMMNQKILIIRFSSFGDVTQCLSVAALLKKKFPQAEVHWVTREDLSELLENNPSIDRIWKLNRKTGLKGLFELSLELFQQKFTHVYDAHNNLRSHVISVFAKRFFLAQFIRKSQFRIKRFFLFSLKLNFYKMPFSGQRDLILPLKKWGIEFELPKPPQLFLQSSAIQKVEQLLQSHKFNNYIALAPSAAFELKRWPIQHWIQLVQTHPDQKFILLGGPTDTFIEQIHQASQNNTLNLAGLLNLQESSAIVQKADLVVSNDTGILHVAEQLGKQTVALMGPAPFGYPSRPTTRILELQLPCKPCSKHGQGPCVNSEYHKCLKGISPTWVSESIYELKK